MTITIKLKTGNAAFENDKEAEIAGILREWLDRGITERRLLDSNGNHVGSVTVTGK